jgi:hypothetical protein
VLSTFTSFASLFHRCSMMKGTRFKTTELLEHSSTLSRWSTVLSKKNMKVGRLRASITPPHHHHYHITHHTTYTHTQTHARTDTQTCTHTLTCTATTITTAHYTPSPSTSTSTHTPSTTTATATSSLSLFLYIPDTIARLTVRRHCPYGLFFSSS